MVADDQQRPLQRQQLDTRHLQAPHHTTPGREAIITARKAPVIRSMRSDIAAHATRISGRGLTTPLNPVPHAPGPPPRASYSAGSRVAAGSDRSHHVTPVRSPVLPVLPLPLRGASRP